MKLIKTLSNCLDKHLTHIYLKNNTEYWIKTKFRFFPAKNLIQVGEKYHIPASQLRTIIEIMKYSYSFADLDINQQRYCSSSNQYYQQEYLELLKETNKQNSKLEQLDKVIQENLDTISISDIAISKPIEPIQLEQLVNHHNPSLRLFAANSLLLTPNQVQQLVQDKNPHVRASMALSPLLTMNDFKKLFKDNHHMVKGLTASSPLITIDKMEYLIKNGDFNIKNSVIRSPYLDEYPSLVEMLKLDNDKRILRLLDYIGL